MPVWFLNYVLIAFNSASSALLHSLLYISGFLPHLWIFWIFQHASSGIVALSYHFVSTSFDCFEESFQASRCEAWLGRSFRVLLGWSELFGASACRTSHSSVLAWSGVMLGKLTKAGSSPLNRSMFQPCVRGKYNNSVIWIYSIFDVCVFNSVIGDAVYKSDIQLTNHISFACVVSNLGPPVNVTLRRCAAFMDCCTPDLPQKQSLSTPTRGCLKTSTLVIQGEWQTTQWNDSSRWSSIKT